MKIDCDNKEFCTAILINLLKAFDFICHNLLIAKLNAYGFNQNALKLIYDYLSDRLQKTKVGSSFSAYLDITYGVPQGWYIYNWGPLLFNIDLCDLFLEDYNSDFANFANDTTPYKHGPKLNEVMNNLETAIEKMFESSSFNNFKANVSKCHLHYSPYQLVPVNIKGSVIETSNCKKLLGIYIDSNFSSQYHINRICYKASQKLHALSRIAKYISEDKKTYAIQIFHNFTIQLAWMCHRRGLNNKINNIYKKALRIVYQDKKSSFETSLKHEKSMSIHVKNLQHLATKLFKVKNDLSPEILKEIFVF